MDKVTKSAHLLPVEVLGKDLRFTSRFWKAFHQALGTNLVLVLHIILRPNKENFLDLKGYA
ncbi:hypothetical protein CR513_08791, partial [Mucuna pruriens]